MLATFLVIALQAQAMPKQLVVPSTVVDPSNWQFVTIGADDDHVNSTVFINLSSIKNREGMKGALQVWILHEPIGPAEIRGKVYKSKKSLFLVRNGFSQMAWVSTIAYSEDGRVVDSHMVSEANLAWEDVVPDSIGEAVCKSLKAEVFKQNVKRGPQRSPGSRGST